jgi:hypothetical protein
MRPEPLRAWVSVALAGRSEFPSAQSEIDVLLHVSRGACARQPGEVEHWTSTRRTRRDGTVPRPPIATDVLRRGAEPGDALVVRFVRSE